MMILHGYWRSSASYRLRIALGLKGIEVEHRAVNLKRGEQFSDIHSELNPQSLVPILELEDGTKLTQSLAILDYLEDVFPHPALLPNDAILKAKIRAASHVIAADISPIQNLRVLKYIRAEHGQDDAAIKAWAAHWISEGFESLEQVVQQSETAYLLTDQPSFFECCLVPQVYNARRFGVDMDRFPRLLDINNLCQTHEVFEEAKPEKQADAV